MKDSEEKKKKDEEDLKLRREKMAANIAAALEEALAFVLPWLVVINRINIDKLIF